MRSATYLSAMAAMMASGAVAKSELTWSHVMFGDIPVMLEGRVDPIVNPGVPSMHVHSVSGPNNFNMNSTGESLVKAKCTSADVKGDMSAYWMPKVYFHDEKAGHYEPVDVFYMKAYYHFRPTDDKIKAFPLGLQMVSGDASLREAPKNKGKVGWYVENGVEPQPASFSCPRSQSSIAASRYAWPQDSDGSKSGFIGPDPNNLEKGVGFPFADCDGSNSPLRADLHFPSCYDPSKGLTNWKENMKWPVMDFKTWRENCPKGTVHVPQLFLEVYWDTKKFRDRWTPNSGKQPFVLSNGDRTGFSLHGDFISGWDEKVLQQMIDGCNAQHAGLKACPGAQENKQKCKIDDDKPVKEEITGKLKNLPGDNGLFGWGITAPKPSGNDSPLPDYQEKPKPVSPPSNEQPKPAPKAEEKPSAQEPPAPQVTSPPVEEPPMEVVTPKVIQTTDAAGKPTQVTVWETTTKWVTKTVYEGEPVATANPKAKQNAAGWAAAGCYRDTRDRVLRGDQRPTLGPMTNSKCVEHCSSKGFSIAGTQYASECYCGNEIAGTAKKIADTDCSMACEGDDADKCGGDWALSVFAKDTSALQKKSVDVNSHNKRHLHNHMLHHRSNKEHFHPRRR
ncbi:hypothetical protein MCOR07_011086 [Pyricularia oryzae]|nr:hypothetical protein MCOR01_002432 [Pyricularia oryzae]KAI6259114.1 hypothetical protein MCOR19_004511 [Pyricularia oryzae]KAI6420899.1 hypothetical protein MCOR21_009490 [Pyricularia oryzae]KAI6472439.1 hypothetical protein MCOR18_008531 [Pyricularia oryzae]KAI6483250.1 hypothetical protein MCOR11_010641 [Pyricularia oryzae]